VVLTALVSEFLEAVDVDAEYAKVICRLVFVDGLLKDLVPSAETPLSSKIRLKHIISTGSSMTISREWRCHRRCRIIKPSD